MSIEDYLSTKEFAKETGYSEQMIRKLAKKGVLKSEPKAGSYLFHNSELDKVKQHKRNTDWGRRKVPVSKKGE